jgi:hypothetical protein
MPTLQIDVDRIVLNLSMPRSLAVKLSKLAVERDQSRSELIRRAVQQTYFHDTPVEGGEDLGVEGCPPDGVGA